MIRASAGSGKTWQLSNRFLALMALGVQPEKIIALTFTKKAAAEFIGRIMTRLAEAASSPEGARSLSDELVKIIKGTGSTPALLTGSSSELPLMDLLFFQKKLEGLIGSLDKLALSTLDSYFVRIVRNFYLELGLSGFDLMASEAVSTEKMGVLTSLFASSGMSQTDKQSFIQSFKFATFGEEENRLSDTLENFVTDHQNRWLAAPDKSKWGGLLPYPDGGSPYAAVLAAKLDLKEAAAHVRELIGEPVSPHKRYMDGWVKACDILSKHKPGDKAALNTQLKRALPIWQNYADGGVVDIEGNSKGFEMALPLGQAITRMLAVYIVHELQVFQVQTAGIHSVIEAYEQIYHKTVRGRGKLCFADLTMLLSGDGAMKLWSDDQRDLIDYRLDSTYEHWMLDEFQDTNQSQWKAIGKLVDEIMQDSSGERSVFVVGDTKQSIYSWRGGDPQLFDDVEEHYSDLLAQWQMDQSYRSSIHVLNFVNEVCDLSAGKWTGVFPVSAIDRWHFHPHIAAVDKPGHTMVLETDVDVKDAKSEEKKEARYTVMKELLEEVDPLSQQMTCAVLVNKNSEVADVMEFLRKELPEMPVISDSETKVADGPIGAVFLDLFRWLANPLHEFGKVHVEMTPLHRVLVSLTETENTEQQWLWLTSELSTYGITALVDTLVTSLSKLEGDNISDYGQSRLQEITAAAEDFSTQGGSISDWVRVLENRSVRETTRDSMIQVMTIHKCKGLGFDIVLLPELEGSKGFTDSARLKVLEEKGELGAINYIIKKPNKELCSADPALQQMLHQWEADQCYESFCKLYVAITRAVHATYCILDPVNDDTWKCKQRFSDWIREATASNGERDIKLGSSNYRVLYESGEWVKRDKAPDDIENIQSELAQDEAKLQPASSRMGRMIASSGKEYQPGDIFNSVSHQGMEFGNQVHQLFEGVTWVDELEGLVDSSAARVVSDCLSQEGIRAHFTQPTLSDGEGFQLLREQPFETQQKGCWISGVIDRAVITLREGKPVSVEIIDFKTDSADGLTEQLLKDKYTEQLSVYRTAISQITGLNQEVIKCYLLSTSMKKMIEV